jgi:hypothetical protein
MNSAWLWIISLIIGTAIVYYGADSGQQYLHMGLTALVCAGYAVLGIWERSRAVAAGADEPAVAAVTSSSMGLVWVWAGLSMLVTYTLALYWHEWWQYVLAGIGVGALCLAFAQMMRKDSAAGRRDETLLKIARYLTIGQFVGMVIAMIGMVVDSKMPRDMREPDWAANGLFFFGAAALAVLSANALWGQGARRA